MPPGKLPGPVGQDASASPASIGAGLGGGVPGAEGGILRRCPRIVMLSSSTMRILAGIMLAAVVVLGTAYGQAPMNKLLIWLESHNNPRGMIVFMVSEAVCVTLLLPAVPLIIAAGLVFGFLKGLLCVWAAGAIGQIGAFLVTRYILRDCMVSFMQKRFPAWDALDKAIQVEGWKLIILLRISPLVPYSVLNVMLGSSGIRFSTFAFFSTIGIIPECMITVYFGTLAGSIANVINGRTGPEGPFRLAIVISGGALMLVAALYAAVVTKKAIKRTMKRAEPEAEATLPTSEPPSMLLHGIVDAGLDVEGEGLPTRGDPLSHESIPAPPEGASHHRAPSGIWAPSLAGLLSGFAPSRVPDSEEKQL